MHFIELVDATIMLLDPVHEVLKCVVMRKESEPKYILMTTPKVFSICTSLRTLVTAKDFLSIRNQWSSVESLSLQAIPCSNFCTTIAVVGEHWLLVPVRRGESPMTLPCASGS